jgi:hypothetical protein
VPWRKIEASLEELSVSRAWLAREVSKGTGFAISADTIRNWIDLDRRVLPEVRQSIFDAIARAARSVE